MGMKKKIKKNCLSLKWFLFSVFVVVVIDWSLLLKIKEKNVNFVILMNFPLHSRTAHTQTPLSLNGLSRISPSANNLKVYVTYIVQRFHNIQELIIGW